MHNISTKTIKAAGAFILVILVAILGLMLFQSRQFHVVKTDPTLNAVSPSAPYMRIYFNNTLYKQSLNFTSSNNIVSNAYVSGKTLTLVFSKDLLENTTYSITINSISNTSGKLIRNKAFTFTTKSIGFNKLSKEQQDYLVNNQDQQPYSIVNINYTGFGKLYDNGMDSEQVYNLQKDLFQYSQSIHKQFRTMAIDPNSVVFHMHDISKNEVTDTVDFAISLSGTPYRAHIEDQISNDTVHTQLFNTAGTLVYDSSD